MRACVYVTVGAQPHRLVYACLSVCACVCRCKTEHMQVYGRLRHTQLCAVLPLMCANVLAGHSPAASGQGRHHWQKLHLQVSGCLQPGLVCLQPCYHHVDAKLPGKASCTDVMRGEAVQTAVANH